MRLSIKTPVFVSIAMATGVVVLLGYFLEVPLLINLRVIFLRWAVVLAAVALLAGIVNLFQVHWKKIKSRQPGSLYSTILIVSMAATLLVAGLFGPNGSWSLWIFNNIQFPIEGSLMAILAVVLVYAITRLFSRHVTVFSLIFLFTVLFVIIGTASIPWVELPVLGELRSWISRVWAAGGARGILLGVALGTVATGLRILMGADRPYSE